MADLEQRMNDLEADVRIHFDIFASRLDTIRAEGNLHHSELQLSLSSIRQTQTTILQLLHGIDDRLRNLENRQP